MRFTNLRSLGSSQAVFLESADPYFSQPTDSTTVRSVLLNQIGLCCSVMQMLAMLTLSVFTSQKEARHIQHFKKCIMQASWFISHKIQQGLGSHLGHYIFVLKWNLFSSTGTMQYFVYLMYCPPLSLCSFLQSYLMKEMRAQLYLKIC